MSDTVRSYGFVVPLTTPLSRQDCSDLNDELWNADSILRINHEGTLLYSDFNLTKSFSERTDIYFFSLGPGNQDETVADMQAAAEAEGLTFDSDAAVPYNCIWYNGGDSPIDALTLAEFNAKLSMIDYPAGI